MLSNIILQRVGARRWIARNMISRGLPSAATAPVTGPTGFFIIRVLLGVAEAGVFPGLLLYFHRWFPQSHRGRVVGRFLTCLPLAEEVRGHSVPSAMANPRVLILSVIFGGIGIAGVGTVLFLSQILKSIGVTNAQAGLLTAVPYVAGTVAIILCGHLSDKRGDRYWTLVVTCGLATAGMWRPAGWMTRCGCWCRSRPRLVSRH